MYSGQRRADLVAITKANLENGRICLVQSKTGVRVSIPLHTRLQQELANGKHDHLALLVTSEGKSFDPVYFGGWFKDAIIEAGLPDDCQLHGLRFTAARMLAEAGCTELEIMAITGHTKPQAWWRSTRATRTKENALTPPFSSLRKGQSMKEKCLTYREKVSNLPAEFTKTIVKSMARPRGVEPLLQD